MKTKLRTTKSNNQIINVLMILVLCAFLTIGCEWNFSTGNGKNTANTSSVANNRTVGSNSDKSIPATSNTTATNSDSSKVVEKTNTNLATKSNDSADPEKGDCTVKADNTDFFIEETEKTIKLKKGTSLQYIQFGNQGLAIVKAQIDGKWVRGEIQDHLVDCPEEK